MYNFKDLIDIHTHSVGSRHAYSTVTENVMYAKTLGLKYYGLSDHAPAMPFTTAGSYFLNLNIIPRDWGEVTLLRGAECNILDPHGKIDLGFETLPRLDYALAAIHRNCMAPTTYDDHTSAYMNVIENPFVKVLAHPDDGRFPYDMEAVVRHAKEYGVLIEVNECSLKSSAYRPNAKENLTKLVKLCKEIKTPMILGSDAHFHLNVGEHKLGRKLLEDLDFPAELIVNFHEDMIREYFLKNLRP